MPSESLLHADIFFLITTIALVIVSTGVIIALVYVIHILKAVKDITDRIREEGVEIIADLKALRKNLRDEGFKWKHVFSLARNFFVRKGSKLKAKVERIIK